MKNLILVLNCGSSSLKFSVINPKNEKKYLFGTVERLFLSDTYVTWESKKNKYKKNIGSNISHEQALDFVIDHIFLLEEKILKNIVGIGHRVVHGGKKIKNSILINDKIINLIEEASIFAPLHNPANLIGIKKILQKYPILSKKNVAVFDTSFYQNMPKVSFLYAIPYDFFKKYGIRRYGAHGISHCYILHKTAFLLQKSFNQLNIITCHLGNGASVSAIRNGICVDTSMGLTPLEGLVMGTRSGDIDPSIIFFMYKQLNMSIHQIEELLIKKSGLLGLSGISSDFRYLEKNYNINEKAKIAVDIFCHRISKYISAYTSLMHGRLDAIIFTGGIGENVPFIRSIIISKLSLLGFFIHSEKNLLICNGKTGNINIKTSRPIFIIPTNEDLAISRETINIISLV
ncbi:Acetate kinase [Buchnera aphidicola (Cavariella theobaldi)]